MPENVVGEIDLMAEKTFTELWDWVMKRSERGVMTVQQREELEHVFNLMRDCDCQSYLEIGAAEGNSLYVLGAIVKGDVRYIDFGEAHTEQARREVTKLNNFGGYLGDSTTPLMYNHVRDKKFDCILIDGGHDFATVLSDSILYAPLATKYVFWHDIQLPEVKRAVDWFVKRWKLGEYSEFINSDTFGYGVLKV